MSRAVVLPSSNLYVEKPTRAAASVARLSKSRIFMDSFQARQPPSTSSWHSARQSDISKENCRHCDNVSYSKFITNLYSGERNVSESSLSWATQAISTRHPT